MSSLMMKSQGGESHEQKEKIRSGGGAGMHNGFFFCRMRRRYGRGDGEGGNSGCFRNVHGDDDDGERHECKDSGSGEV